MQLLATERLRLGTWTDADADVDFIFDTYSRWEVQRFIGLAPRVMERRAEAEAAIAVRRSLDHPVHGNWAVERMEDGQLLGTVMLQPIPASSEQSPPPRSGDIEVGWHFTPTPGATATPRKRPPGSSPTPSAPDCPRWLRSPTGPTSPPSAWPSELG